MCLYYHIFFLSYLYCIFLVLAYTDFRIWPNRQSVPVFSAAIIYCNSEDKALWIYKEKLIGRNKTLVIHLITRRHHGVYICKGTHESGKTFIAQSTIVVTSREQVYKTY